MVSEPGEPFDASVAPGPHASLVGVLIVEDHPAMRNALRSLIDGEPDLTVVAEADSAEAALDQVSRLDPDVLLVDLSLPQMSGLDLLDIVGRTRPQLRCVVVTGHVHPVYRAAAEAAGAAGFVVKDDPSAVLAMVRDVAQNPL